MKPSSKHPVIYEINTWVWLCELSRKYQRTVNLATVPDRSGMPSPPLDLTPSGSWGCGNAARPGSPSRCETKGSSRISSGRCRIFPLRTMSARRIVCAATWSTRISAGRQGLATARRALAERGVGLILDFVPNHVAPDHPWVVEHPEYFIRGNEQDLEKDPASFCEAAGNVFACGRDPYFPAWPDVLQLNAFQPGLRAAVIETVSGDSRTV